MSSLTLAPAKIPQTNTIFQWYDLKEFEAYRHLGERLAYLPSPLFKGGTAGECGLRCVDAPNRGKNYSGHGHREYDSIALDLQD
jgi:hypothetical protein